MCQHNLPCSIVYAHCLLPGRAFASLYVLLFLEKEAEIGGRAIELEFQMKTPYNKLAKIYANGYSYMTKMADMPIYGKNPLKIFFSRTKRPMTLGLGM